MTAWNVYLVYAENFNTWKAAFRNMAKDVDLTTSRLALLHNAYIENPTARVRESWKKPGKCFGSTAVITNLHLNKLTMFPALAAKDNKGLEEWRDLLLELQCAKEKMMV